MQIVEYLTADGSGPFARWFDELDAQIIVLVGGGTKRRQQRDIETAQSRWADYRRRKRGNL